MSTTTDGPGLEWEPLWDAMRADHAAGRVRWVRTTQAMYDAMLNVLPPAWWVAGGFLVGEPYRHDDEGRAVFAAFTRRADGYAACYLRLAEFRRLVG